jgi:hypothetical protein
VLEVPHLAIKLDTPVFWRRQVSEVSGDSFFAHPGPRRPSELLTERWVDHTLDAHRRDVVRDHLEGLSKRFAEGLKKYEEEEAKKVDPLAGLNARFANGQNPKVNGRTPPASSSEDALNEASAKWLKENARRDH